MPIGLIRLFTTQKVLKTCINKGVKYHFLGSNQARVGLHRGYGLCRSCPSCLCKYQEESL